MLKVLHTADWHLGKDLYTYDRTEEFELFFSELKSVIRNENIDILLVAGDVFDTASPGNAVAKRYYELICDLHSEFSDLDIIITAGNHDSPSYLNAPKEVLLSQKTIVIGSVAKIDGNIDYNSLVFEISKNGEPAAIICAVPFLRRGDLYDSMSQPISVSQFYQDVAQIAIELRGDKNIPIIATGHLTTSNAEYSTSIAGDQVGGQDSINAAELPSDFTYFALGHIHKPQPVDGNRAVRYSGSPIAFSFAEKDYKHSFAVIEFNGNSINGIKLCNIPQLIPLKTIPDEPQSFNDVKQQLLQIPDDEKMYLEVNLLQQDINPDTKAQIINCLKTKAAKFCTFKKNIVKQQGRSEQKHLSAEEFRHADPLEIIKEIYMNKQKCKMEDKYVVMLKDILDNLN